MRRLIEAELWADYQTSNRSEAARNRLVEHYLGLVESIAAKLQQTLPRNVELDGDDLYGEGVLGLIGAIERFDLQRGLRFSTFAAFRIRGAMIDALRAIDFVPRLERSRQKRGLATVAKMHCLNDTHAGWEEPDDPNAKWSWLDYVASAPPDDQMLSEGWLAPVLDALPARERTVLVLYFLGGRTMRDIAQRLELSESRISQMLGNMRPRVEQLCRRHLVRDW